MLPVSSMHVVETLVVICHWHDRLLKPTLIHIVPADHCCLPELTPVGVLLSLLACPANHVLLLGSAIEDSYDMRNAPTAAFFKIKVHP